MDTTRELLGAKLMQDSAQHIASAQHRMQILMHEADSHRNAREQKKEDAQILKESAKAEEIAAQVTSKLAKPREHLLEEIRPFATSTAIATPTNGFETLIVRLVSHVAKENGMIEDGRAQLPSTRVAGKLPHNILAVGGDSPWNPLLVCIRIACSQCFQREMAFSMLKSDAKLNKRSSVVAILAEQKDATNLDAAAADVHRFIANHLVSNIVVPNGTEELMMLSGCAKTLDTRAADSLASNLSTMCRLVAIAAGEAPADANNLGLTGAIRLLRNPDANPGKYDRWAAAAHQTKLDIFVDMLAKMGFADVLHKDDRRAVLELASLLGTGDDGDASEDGIEEVV